MNEKWSTVVRVELRQHGGDPAFIAEWLREQAGWIVEHWDELAGECTLSLYRESE